MKSNRKSKDTLFRFIFGNEQRKKYTLILYNWLNQTDYRDENQIKLITLEDVIYISFKNDIGFLINDELNLYEQQSSWNPNMPARLLRYYDRELTQWEDDKIIDLFSRKLQPLPVPKMAVFYNGKANKPEVSVLRLSDSFNGKQGSIEVTVPVYNINTDSELIRNCRPLYEYCWFVHQLEGADQNTLLEKINYAVDNMPEDFEIRELLQREKRKVTDMMYSEYTEEYFKQTLRNDGIYEERMNSVRIAYELLRNVGLTDEQARENLLSVYDEDEITEFVPHKADTMPSEGKESVILKISDSAAKEEGRQEGVQASYELLREAGFNEEETKERLLTKFTPEEVNKTLKK